MFLDITNQVGMIFGMLMEYRIYGMFTREVMITMITYGDCWWTIFRQSYIGILLDVFGCRWMLMDVVGCWTIILTFIHDVLYDDQRYQDMPGV